ncbi:MAG: hypothetical protein WC254_03240 [Candidatus Woesearchaeota archaeon]|jgi:hypothetical protein
MCYGKWMDKKIKKLNWLDYKLVKWSVVAFTLFIAKVWPTILYLDWYWYALAGIVFAIRPLYKMFTK